jgi:plasmid stability protein
MSKMIQIRNVPDSLHRTLVVRAAQTGLSLSDYLLAELRRTAERPTLAELRERIGARGRAETGEPAATAIRSERDAREAHLEAATRAGGKPKARRPKSA